MKSTITEKVIGAIVVVKFYRNPVQSPNTLITRTLKRIGVISSNYRGPKPKDGELWLARIVNQTGDFQYGKGVFILFPIRQMELHKVVSLSEDEYTYEIHKNLMVALPKDSAYAVMSIKEKKKHDSMNAIVMRLNELELDFGGNK